MFTEFSAKNYGCLKDVRCKLTPLHAFIGPNDSGKSTLLRALTSMVNLAATAQGISWPRAQGTSSELEVVGTGSTAPRFKVVVDDRRGWTSSASVGGQVHSSQTLDSFNSLAMQMGNSDFTTLTTFRGARLVRFDADSLRQRSALVPDGAELDFLDQRGRGLPGIYDAILKRGDGTFEAIRNELTTLFPTAKFLRLRNLNPGELVLEVELHDGTKVPADAMSEGMLYYLAFAALRSLRVISLLAVEEPENGLHPARVAEVMRLLRAISEMGIQVVVATHSPLVVNELNPAEVSIVTRTVEHGTRVQPIAGTPDFEERSKVYALGELWLSYANGRDEAPLLKGGPRQ